MVIGVHRPRGEGQAGLGGSSIGSHRVSRVAEDKMKLGIQDKVFGPFEKSRSRPGAPLGFVDGLPSAKSLRARAGHVSAAIDAAPRSVLRTNRV